jgi:hypothetical protein
MEKKIYKYYMGFRCILDLKCSLSSIRKEKRKIHIAMFGQLKVCVTAAVLEITQCGIYQ